MLTCFLDCDGILADFVGGVCQFFQEDDPYRVPRNHGIWDFFKLIENKKNLTEKDFYSVMGESFWSHLPLTHDARAILDLVEARFTPPGVFLLTAPVRTLGCISGKELWVRYHVPLLLDRFIPTRHKHLFAQPHHVLIDDSDANVNSFRTHGGQAFLYPRPWNSAHEHSSQSLPLLQEFLNTL